MTAVRALWIAAAVFVAGSSLAYESWAERAAERDLLALAERLRDAAEARDRAQDRYDAAIYALLYPGGAAPPEFTEGARAPHPDPTPGAPLTRVVLVAWPGPDGGPGGG